MSHDDTSRTTAHEDKLSPVLPVAYQAHTLANPFCWDSTCTCHQNIEARIQVAQAHRDGLCTVEEATRLLDGKQV